MLMGRRLEYSSRNLNREHRGGRYSEYSHAMRFGNGGEGEDVKLVRRRVLLEYSRLGVLVEL